MYYTVTRKYKLMCVTSPLICGHTATLPSKRNITAIINAKVAFWNTKVF